MLAAHTSNFDCLNLTAWSINFVVNTRDLQFESSFYLCIGSAILHSPILLSAVSIAIANYG